MVSRSVPANRSKCVEQVAGGGHGAGPGAEAKHPCLRHGATIGGDKGGTPRSWGCLPVSSLRPERRRVRKLVRHGTSTKTPVFSRFQWWVVPKPAWCELSLSPVFLSCCGASFPLPSPSENPTSTKKSCLRIHDRPSLPRFPPAYRFACFLVLPGTEK